MILIIVIIFFFFKQKTAYEMRISDWSSDVCSSDLGVPVSHLGHMAQLLDGIPVGEMNPSMTINAPAAWLLGLYVAHAEDTGVASTALRGTPQNDVVTTHLSRATYICPQLPYRRLTVAMLPFFPANGPLWNPITAT